MMCRILNVSRSGFYAWLKRPESPTEQANHSLIGLIKQVYQTSKGAYGAPRIYADLKAQGFRYGKNRIAKLMKQIGLRGCPRKKYKRFSQESPSYPLADNLLSRQFNVDKPNAVWSSDITYVQTRQGFLYCKRLGKDV